MGRREFFVIFIEKYNEPIDGPMRWTNNNGYSKKYS
jgi:hypothetical protein